MDNLPNLGSHGSDISASLIDNKMKRKRHGVETEKESEKKKNKDGKKSESMIISPLLEIASQGFQGSFFFYSRDFNYDLIILPPTQRVRERENP